MRGTSHDGRTKVLEYLLHSNVIAYTSTSCTWYTGTYGCHTVRRCPEALLLFTNHCRIWCFIHAVGGPGERSRYNDSLLDGRSGCRIPVSVRFTAPVQTGPRTTQPTLQWVPGLFPGGKGPGRGVDHPPHLAPRFKERVELDFYSPFGTSWSVLG